jgi:hypothetical protein
MKTTILTLACILIIATNACAQDNALLAGVPGANPVIPHGYMFHDLVGPDLQPTNDINVAMHRAVREVANGFEVRVLSADGRVRMTGIYSDAELTVANGLFVYYHMNGEVESSGVYVNGTKKGLWERFAPNGLRKADRVYGPGTYEEIAIEQGWVTVARSIGQ